MFKNKNGDGLNNVCGKQVAFLRRRTVPKMSQRMLAEKMQLMGIDMNKNAIQRIECGKRFVPDIELVALSNIFGVSCDTLLGLPERR